MAPKARGSRRWGRVSGDEGNPVSIYFVGDTPFLLAFCFLNILPSRGARFGPVLAFWDPTQPFQTAKNPEPDRESWVGERAESPHLSSPTSHPTPPSAQPAPLPATVLRLVSPKVGRGGPAQSRGPRCCQKSAYT